MAIHDINMDVVSAGRFNSADFIAEAPDIPYTLSGKKMEVPVKKIFMGIDIYGQFRQLYHSIAIFSWQHRFRELLLHHAKKVPEIPDQCPLPAKYAMNGRISYLLQLCEQHQRL